MAARTLVLASASPARLRLLQDAGLRPLVEVSEVDEGAVSDPDPRRLVATLAARKAEVVAARHTDELVLGCDSMLLFDGLLLGKTDSPAEIARRWRGFRSRQGVLLTGHCLIDTASGQRAAAVGETTVRFGAPSEAEIGAYARTEEARRVAGPFTIDGRAAAFVEGIDGDAGNVIGLSLPVLRRLLAQVGVQVTDLWC